MPYILGTRSFIDIGCRRFVVMEPIGVAEYESQKGLPHSPASPQVALSFVTPTHSEAWVEIGRASLGAQSSPEHSCLGPNTLLLPILCDSDRE